MKNIRIICGIDTGDIIAPLHLSDGPFPFPADLDEHGVDAVVFEFFGVDDVRISEAKSIRVTYDENNAPVLAIEDHSAEEKDSANIKILRTKIDKEIDRRTEELIVAGIDYGGEHFTLTRDHQAKARALFNARFELEKRNRYPYPLTADGRKAEVIITDTDQMEEFYMDHVMVHIENATRSGDYLKDSLLDMTLSELQDFEDTR